MAEEIVRIIKVETKNSGKSIRDLRKEINALKKELEQTAVGTEEFEATLKQLTQTQKSYNTVQQQIRDMSRTNQQDMVKFASFARNLGKSYSALNAAVGLFADKNEDVQKSMLKVQRTIQLIQGLDGFVGIIRDLPKVLAGFRSWFDALDPIEKKVNSIVKGINGADPKKLAAINEANRAAASGTGGTTTITAKASAGEGARPLTALKESEIKESTRVLAANGKAAENAGAQFAKLNSIMTEYTETLEKYNDADVFAGLTEEQRIKTAEELDKQINESEKALKSELETINWTNASRKEALELIKNQRLMLEGQIKGITDVEAKETAWYKATSKQIELLKEQENELKITTKTLKGFGKTLKSAFSFVWFNAVVLAIVAAITAIAKYAKKLKEAAEEQKRFNKELSTTTNQIAAKQLVALRQLANAYKAVGDSAEEKQKVLDQYKDKIKETGLAIEDVNQADEVFINNTSKYVNAIMARAKAQAAENMAIKIYEQYLNDLYDLEQEIENWKPDAANISGYVGSGYISKNAAEEQRQFVESLAEENRKKVQEKIDELTKETDEKINKLLNNVITLNGEAQGAADALAKIKIEPEKKDDSDWKAWLEQKKEDLETLKKANEEALKVFMDSRTKELQDVAKHYDELIELAKKYGQDTTLLEAARQREIQDIIDKYNDEALKKEKEKIDEQYQLIQTQIERIRKMDMSSNLREPQEQLYQTWYRQSALEGLFFDDAVLRKLGVPGFATGRNWTNVYQSREDVEMQYKAQVEYNDTLYLLTKQRIEQENKLLEEQLQIVGLDADKKLEIERTLVENEMALSDAQLKNEQDNTKAYLEAQEKRRQALNSTLDVTSTMAGALANIAKIEAQTAEEGSERQKNATKAYKAFAITQAIVDTYKSANESYAAMASIPYVGPALGIAAAAAAIVSGIANVKSIISESISGSSVNSGASVTAPSALSTPPIEYTRNLLGDKELDELNQPLKCYVLESDITKTQNKVKVAENNATF